MAQSKVKREDNRTRNWNIEVYPESAPENWREIIDQERIPWVESPLHEYDLKDDGSGECKKPHWHCILFYDNKKSYEQVEALTSAINAPRPERTASTRGSVRYLVHMDHKDKHRYNVADIVAHNGAEIDKHLKATDEARRELLREMGRFVRERDVTEYIDFFDYAGEHRYDDWFPLLCESPANALKEVIRSNRHRLEVMKNETIA